MRPTFALRLVALLGLGIVSSGCSKKPDAPVVVVEPPKAGPPAVAADPAPQQSPTPVKHLENPHHLRVGGPVKVTGLNVWINGACDSKADVQRIMWSWGDGTPEVHSYFPARHRYQKPGTYRVHVTTHDREGKTSADSIEVIVPVPDPERTAADWAVERGGNVQIVTDGNRVSDYKTAAGGTRQAFQVRSINLFGKPIAPEDLVNLEGLQAIQHLDLGNTKANDGALAHLKGLKSLTALNVQGCGISDAGVIHLRPLTSLQFLLLNGCSITAEGLTHLQDMTRMQELGVRDARLTDESLAVLANMKDLKSLDLNHTPVTGIGLAHLAGLSSLTRLTIGDNAGVTNKGLKGLAECKSLNVLNLSNTKIADAALEHFKSLKLHRLYLRNTKVAGPGLAALKGMESLLELDLSLSPVTDAAIPALKELPALAKLNLTGTKVTDAGIAELKTSLPKCQIDR